MKKVTMWVMIALDLLTTMLPALAEPISDQGLVRSFVETSAFPRKVNNGRLMLPAGMKQSLSIRDVFSERDVQKDGLAEYDCRSNEALPMIMLKPKAPDEPSPRIF